MEKDVDYFESYAPVASWSTIRVILVMAMQHNWTINQVDFDNAFVQAPLDKDVYIELPPMFQDESWMDKKEVCLKLKKSLYGMVDAPRNFYLHIRKGLNKLGFQQSENDPGIYFGRGMVLILYVDDLLLCGPDPEEIKKVLKELKDNGHEHTEEEKENDAFSFLGIELKVNGEEVKFTQLGLITKVLETTGMIDCNSKRTPAGINPLGTDADGEEVKESWNYASVIGMMMYLASNAYPEIQFAVHQCARFTHCPKQSHAQAVKKEFASTLNMCWNKNKA